MRAVNPFCKQSARYLMVLGVGEPKFNWPVNSLDFCRAGNRCFQLPLFSKLIEIYMMYKRSAKQLSGIFCYPLPSMQFYLEIMVISVLISALVSNHLILQNKFREHHTQTVSCYIFSKTSSVVGISVQCLLSLSHIQH